MPLLGKFNIHGNAGGASSSETQRTLPSVDLVAGCLFTRAEQHAQIACSKYNTLSYQEQHFCKAW